MMRVKLRDAGIVKHCEAITNPASSGASPHRCAHRPPGGSPLPRSSACACGCHHKPGSKRRSERMCTMMAIRGPTEPSRGCAGRAQARCGCQQEPGRGQRQSSACVVRLAPRARRGPDQRAHGPGSRRRRGTGPQPCPQRRTCGGDASCSHPCWLCCSPRFGAATPPPSARATAHMCVSCGDSAPPRTARGRRQTRDRQCMRPYERSPNSANMRSMRLRHEVRCGGARRGGAGRALAVGDVEGHVAERQQLEQQHDEEERRQPLERVLRRLAQVQEGQPCARALAPASRLPITGLLPSACMIKIVCFGDKRSVPGVT